MGARPDDTATHVDSPLALSCSYSVRDEDQDATQLVRAAMIFFQSTMKNIAEIALVIIFVFKPRPSRPTVAALGVVGYGSG